MTTAEKIRLLRIQKGMTQEELGKKCGLQRAAINKYEKGTVINIKRSVLQEIADALGVASVDLLDDEEFLLPRNDQIKRLLLYLDQMNDAQVEMLITVAKSLTETT